MIRFETIESKPKRAAQSLVRQPETNSRQLETVSPKAHGGARESAGRKSDKPWLAAGMSRAAWYRQKGKA